MPSPGLIRLEFATHKDDFKSYTLHMGSDIVYQSTHLKVSFSLFPLVCGLADWSGYGGQGLGGWLNLSHAVFCFVILLPLSFLFTFPPQAPSLLF